VRRIDHEHLPEIGGELIAGAQEIDDVADRPVLGHRDRVAAHQPAGAVLGEGERFLDRGAVVGVERAQHGALLLFLQILDEGDRVVGLQLARDLGDLVRLQFLEQCLADMLVHLGEHVSVEDLGERGGERRTVVGQFEQIGDVGGVERLDQRARPLVVAGFDQRHHLIDEFGLQPVVLVQAGIGGFEVALAHPALLRFARCWRGFLGRGSCPVETRGLSAPAKEQPMSEQNNLVLNLDSGGDVVIRLRPDLAPGHVARIRGAGRRSDRDRHRRLEKARPPGRVQQHTARPRHRLDGALVQPGQRQQPVLPLPRRLRLPRRPIHRVGRGDRRHGACRRPAQGRAAPRARPDRQSVVAGLTSWRAASRSSPAPRPGLAPSSPGNA
jgi:hypothetical protein